MTNRSTLQRAYFAAVAALALLVAMVGLLLPHSLPEVLPLQLPPLHARFVGALYAGGAVSMLLARRARSALAVRSTLDLTCIWTGALLGLTALRWGDFDHHHRGLWIWLGAYLAFPIGAWWLRHTETPLQVPPALHIRQGWVLALLRAQGLLVLALAVGLFVWPDAAGTLWPWKIPALLAQVYAGPLLAVSLTSLLLAQRRHWAEIGPPCAGLAVFAALALLGAALHLPLFDPDRLVTWCWLAGLCAVGVGSARLAQMAALQARADRHGAALRQGAVA